MMRRTLPGLAPTVADTEAPQPPANGRNGTPRTGYTPVNGLHMYYEVHGSPNGDAPPLLILHGALATLDMFGALLPYLAETRQVIAVEQQAHGRTADIDRPLRYEQMADDTAALLGFLGVDRVDVFGFSMGVASPGSSSPAIPPWCASWWPARPATRGATATARRRAAWR
jgi:pimeloyl-ACP methyl ester carboxylesterase